ncbi:hypothetical protein [Halosimplex amylolyticum]|uniref:hypothetical protein n=1 Tax=Halosimplex amylolyticum TaxID=3396616 RepID=UPI003F566BE3
MPSIPTGAFGSTAAKAVVVVAFLAIGGVAAAEIGVFEDVVGQDDSDAIDQVPDGVDSVATLDASVLEEDVSARLYATAYNATVGASTGGSESETTATTATPAGDGADETDEDETDGFDDEPRTATSPVEMVPANLSAALDETENQTGLDPRAAEEVTFFEKQRENYTQPRYAGAVVHADWTESAVVEAASNNSDTEYENTTIDGVTVYQPVENESEDEDELSFGPPEPEEWIAVLDDGEYAFGTQQAVNDTIAVAVGDADPVDGDLRSAYEETRDDGYVRYAQRSQNVNVTRINQTMGQRTGLNVTAYAEAYNDLHVTSGSYYIADDKLGVESRILTNSTETARDVADITQGFISIQAGAIQNETLETQLRSTNVTQDGTTVTVSRETPVDTAAKLVRWYGSILTGSGQTGSAAAQPTV